MYKVTPPEGAPKYVTAPSADRARSKFSVEQGVRVEALPLTPTEKALAEVRDMTPEERQELLKKLEAAA